MMGCKHCGGWCASIILILGILFLLRDLNVWNFWNIQWWTALFIIMGIGGLCMKGCSCCKETGEKKAEMKKK
ncbi:MAG: hypothetical protein V1743_05365 [Nanoarchaeota archaeon]